MTIIHIQYITAAIQRTGVGLQLLERLSDLQVALIVLLLLPLQHFAFATDKRHLAIEYEFTQRPIKPWVGNTILLLWFTLGPAWITIEMAIK